MIYKKPVSVLVVIHTPALDVLLLERARHPGFWQSVTAFVDWHTANCYEIFAEWRDRYAPGVTENTEHVFSLCLPEPCPVTLADGEHLAWRWLPWQDAAAECFSWTNRDAILALPRRFAPVA
jgi:dATP pyrophosphohydrolase